MKNGHTVPGGIFMLMLIFFCFIGCGTNNPAYKQPRAEDIVMNVLPVISISTKIDTPKIIQTAKSLKVDPELNQLITQTNNPNASNEKLQDLNLKWQELTLRVLDSARNRKKDKDSVLSILKSFKSENGKQLAEMQKQNNAKFKEVLAAKNLNTSTYSMFETLGTICFITIILSYVIVGLGWIAKKFKKLPAL